MTPTRSPILFCNNIGATYLTANPNFHAWTKHIELNFHLVWDGVTARLLDVQFIASHDQLADGLMKPFLMIRFTRMSHNLNVRLLPLKLRENIKDGALKSSDHNFNQEKVKSGATILFS